MGPRPLPVQRFTKYALPFDLSWTRVRLWPAPPHFCTVGIDAHEHDTGWSRGSIGRSVNAPIDVDSCVFWWGWQRPFELAPDSRRFRGYFRMRPGDIELAGGGDYAIFAAILQVDPQTQSPVDGAYVPIPNSEVQFPLDFEAERTGTWDIRMMWILRISFDGQNENQLPQLRAGGVFPSFWHERPVPVEETEGTPEPPTDDPVKEVPPALPALPGSERLSASAMRAFLGTSEER